MPSILLTLVGVAKAWFTSLKSGPLGLSSSWRTPSQFIPGGQASQETSLPLVFDLSKGRKVLEDVCLEVHGENDANRKRE